MTKPVFGFNITMIFTEIHVYAKQEYLFMKRGIIRLTRYFKERVWLVENE